jgi:calcineurin-like phosphoesterase family protein
MSEIWMTADIHLDHANILEHMPLRGEAFRNIHHMEDAFIDTINELVKPKDLLIIAGDFCWRAGKCGHFRQRLNVREIYVARGNHDAASLAKHVSRMEHMLFLKLAGKHFHIQHYPCLSWGKMQHGGIHCYGNSYDNGCASDNEGIHCYGHSHGMFEETLDELWPFRNSMDVGMDNALQLTGQFRPFHIDEIIARCSNESKRIDH